MKSKLKSEMMSLVGQDLRNIGIAFVMLSTGTAMLGTIEPSAFAFGLVAGFIMITLGYTIKALIVLLGGE